MILRERFRLFTEQDDNVLRSRRNRQQRITGSPDRIHRRIITSPAYDSESLWMLQHSYHQAFLAPSSSSSARGSATSTLCFARNTRILSQSAAGAANCYREVFTIGCSIRCKPAVSSWSRLYPAKFIVGDNLKIVPLQVS